MSAPPTFTVHEHSLESDEDLRESLDLSVGTRFVVLSSGPTQLVLQRQELSRKETSSPGDHMGAWASLRGILAGDGVDTTEQKTQEREWELAHDERKFGVPRPEW